MRHFLEIDDLSRDEFTAICSLGRLPKTEVEPTYAGRGVACVFEKPSVRTRNSTEMAVVQLGGHPIYITNAEVGIDTRESAEDVARTLSQYHSVICARVFDHGVLERMAALDVAPVVNLLSDQSHPLQAIADVLTIEAEYGSLDGRIVTYVGDANNVARSLALAVGFAGGTTRIAAPAGHQFSAVDVDRLATAEVPVEYFDRPSVAIAGSDVVYTDTWVSMGQEDERDERLRHFEGFMVDDALMSAAPKAIFMHCLPAHRGEEVSSSVMDGSQSRIWPQAANRLNAIRGVLAWLEQQGSLRS